MKTEIKKDCELQTNTLTLYNKTDKQTGQTDDKSFLASKGWIYRMRNRNNMVSWMQTSCKVLPQNAAELATKFLKDAQDALAKVEPCNVINMDQVPRYFEGTQTKTVTKKGTKNVFLKKASTSHKRFTATFAITGDENILKPHLLFSNLKNRPKVNKGCIVDVNKTGMFSSEILCSINFAY